MTARRDIDVEATGGRTAATVFDELVARGLAVTVEGDRLLVGPSQLLTDAIRAEITAQREGIKRIASDCCPYCGEAFHMFAYSGRAGLYCPSVHYVRSWPTDERQFPFDAVSDCRDCGARRETWRGRCEACVELLYLIPDQKLHLRGGPERHSTWGRLREAKLWHCLDCYPNLALRDQMVVYSEE